MSFISQKAGIADIKMTVRDGTAGPVILVHDFLVGWMNLNSIVLCNNPAAGPCTGPTTSVISDTAGADDAERFGGERHREHPVAAGLQ